MRKQSGALIVLTGPSGVGKGTLRQRLSAQMPWLRASISATTRPMRPGETDGVEYFFVSRETFDTLIAEDALVEWAEYAGNLYGTPRSALEAVLESGDSLLLEIEVQGAFNIQRMFPDTAHLVFIAPPSLEALEARLRGRNANNEAEIKTRLAWSVKELAQQNQFHHVIVNDDLNTAEAELKALIATLLPHTATPGA